MRLLPRVYLLAAGLLVAAAMLAGCGVDAPAQAEPGTVSDILPTPPPMPTSEPLPPTATPPPAPAGEPGTAGAGVLSSDFSDPAALSNWTVIDATDLPTPPSIWKIEAGYLVQVSDGDGFPGLYQTALVTGDPAWSDYRVSASAYATNNDEMGVVARANDGGYYVFRLLPAAGSKPAYILSRYDAAEVRFTDIAEAEGAGFEPGQWYRLSVAVQGDHIQAFVDDRLVIDTHDATFAQGRAGVYGYAQGNLQFDNFAVQSLPGAR